MAALSPAPQRPLFVLPYEVLSSKERVNGRAYADSLAIVILTELVRRATAALLAQPQTEALPPRLVRRIVESIDVHPALPHLRTNRHVAL